MVGWGVKTALDSKLEYLGYIINEWGVLGNQRWKDLFKVKNLDLTCLLRT